MFENIPVFLGADGWINGNMYHTRLCNPQIGKVPLRTVRADGGNFIASPVSHGDESDAYHVYKISYLFR